MLITTYSLELALSRHSDQEISYEAVARLKTDISPVMPYLNATISRAIYVPAQPSVSWRHEGHNVGFWSDRIAADDFGSQQEAEQFMERLVALVNTHWERRHEIEPDHTTHQRLQPLQVLRLLPRTNCRRCGQETCFNFALRLVAAQAEVTACSPLQDHEGYALQRVQLEEMVATRWPAL